MTRPPESMRYRVVHETEYSYSSPVAICQNQLRMMPSPRNTVTSALECHHVDVTVSPQPTVTQEHIDYFGNQVYAFAIESLHRELIVRVSSDVTVRWPTCAANAPTVDWESVISKISATENPNWIDVQEFIFDSPRIQRSKIFADYARESFRSGRTITDAATDLTSRIHADFRYDTSATDVHTTTEEAFDLRAGVCQDFAHVQIACLRSLGIPARYVSGYLRTKPQPGKTRLIGADESHAWVSVYTGAESGWVDFDPTNDCLANINHIPICIGRDYSEVSPMRGVVIGGGTTTLQVSVDVSAIEDPESIEPK